MAGRRKRAVGIIRVSRTKGEEAVSPAEQTRIIERECERLKMEVVARIEELDVSGGRPLARRPGLSRALAMIEAGEAEVLIGAYLDRLFRSIRVQAEVTERVEAAGGEVLAVDLGAVNGSATKRLTAGLMGQIAQYLRETTAERTHEAKARAVARGVPPFSRIPPGLRQINDEGSPRHRTLELHPREAPLMREAFEMRAAGASIEDIRLFLRANGISRPASSVTRLLSNRLYLGELHFGPKIPPNLNAVEPITDADTFRRAQTMFVPRGPRPPSERLLARLGVLRCASCESRLVISQSRSEAGGRIRLRYRCPDVECAHRVTISAEAIEQQVIETVKILIDGMRGEASSDQGVAEAMADLEMAENALTRAIRAFDAVSDVEEARDRLEELRRDRDDAADRVHELRLGASSAVTVDTADVDDAPPAVLRELIRATLRTVTVAPGRGPDRVGFEAR